MYETGSAADFAGPVRKVQRKRSRGKKMLIAIELAVLAVLAICVGIAAFVGWSLTHPARKPVDDSPERYGLVYDNVVFSSRDDNVSLSGWFIPASAAVRSAGTEAQKPKGMTLVFAHGYAGNRLEKGLPALALAKSLVTAGYNVLMFDFRNSGESAGKLTSVGQFEKRDLLGAVDWVRSNHPGKIGLIGFSMGATTAILAAAEEPDVVGVVADSPFARLRDYLEENLPVWSNLPSFPFTMLIMTIMPPITGIDVDEVDALAQVDRVYPRPILFIHSADDTKIPYVNSELLWSRHPDRFEFWKTEKADHVDSYMMQPEEYTRRVLAFLEKL